MNWLARQLLEQFLGSSHRVPKVVAALMSDKPVIPSVRCHLVSGRRYAADHFRVLVSDPAKYEERGTGIVLVKHLEEPGDAGHYPALESTPTVSADLRLECRDLEVLLDVYAEVVDHPQSKYRFRIVSSFPWSAVQAGGGTMACQRLKRFAMYVPRWKNPLQYLPHVIDFALCGVGSLAGPTSSNPTNVG